MLFTTQTLLPLAILTAVLGSPLPTPETSLTTCDKITTRLDFYQGPSSSSCGVNVGKGNLTSGVCLNILTQGLMLFPAAEDCTFSLFKGVTDCSGGAAQTVELKAVEQGAQATGTCVQTGVMDGGKWYHGSGWLSCGCN